jgi:hypothetical protein
MHNKIDPVKEYCACGYSFTPSLFMKIILLVRGEYTVTCPRCQTEMELCLCSSVYVKRRKNNTDKGIWKNG